MKYKLNPQYAPKFHNFLLDIKSYFKKNDNSIHKARNELKIITYENIDIVVKSFKVPNLLRRIFYTYFRDTKAKKSYDNSIKIGDFTPKPIGYIEFFKGELLDESYFIAKKFDYDFTIREPLLDKNFANREVIFKAFAFFTYQLHESNIFHNDYSPGNILIKEDEIGYIFKIVDINRMKFLELSSDMRAKNFEKLWADDEDLKIMAEAYCQSYHCDDNFSQRVLYYSNKNKKIKNFKKRLKGKPVNG